MNKEQRNTLDGAINELREAKGLLDDVDYSEVVDLLESAKAAIDKIKEEEDEAFQDLSEESQQTKKGQRMEEIIGILDDTLSNIDELISSIADQDLTGGFDEVIDQIESTKE